MPRELFGASTLIAAGGNMEDDQAFLEILRHFDNNGAASSNAEVAACKQIEHALRRAAMRLPAIRRRTKRQGEAPATASDAEWTLPSLDGSGIVEGEILELAYDVTRRAAFSHKVLAQMRRGPAGIRSAKTALASVARYTVRQWSDRIDAVAAQVRTSLRTAVDAAVKRGEIEKLSVIKVRRAGDLDAAVSKGLLAPPIAKVTRRQTTVVFAPWDKNKHGAAYGIEHTDRYFGLPGMRARLAAAKDPLAVLRAEAPSYSDVVRAVSRLEPADVRFAPLAEGGTAVPQIVRRTIADRAARLLRDLGAPVERRAFLNALRRLISYPGLRGTLTAQQAFMGSNASTPDARDTEELFADFLDAAGQDPSGRRSGSAC